MSFSFGAGRGEGRALRALLVGLLVGGSARAGTDYYVATNGNDGNAGTTPGAPWRTIQRAVHEPVAPGDTVHVADGTYVGWATDISGTPTAPITWVADGPNVTVDRPVSGGPGNSSDNIRLMYADWNVIDGFRSVNAPRAGIAVRGDKDVPIVGCTVRSCTCDANQNWGIFDAFANQCTYEGNICSNSRDEHGIYHSNSGDDGVIRGNVVFGNDSNGLHLNGDLSQGGDGVISRMLIEDNVIFGNGTGGGGGINMDGVQDSLIRNNLLYDNHASGIIGYRIDAAEASSGNVICNNTVIMASDGRWALKLVDGSTGCTVFNNVLYRDHSFRGSFAIDAASLPGLASDWNVVVDRFSLDGDNTTITLAQWRAATGQDTHSMLITAATLVAFFADPAANDWHLAAGSPALDAGTASLAGSTAPAEDFEGDPRPADVGFDIGCDEHPTGCLAGFSHYGSGWPGTLGVPALDVSAPPVLGTTIDLHAGNSSGSDAFALLFVGFARASLHTGFGGDLLLIPAFALPLSVPAAGLDLSFAVPPDDAFCGVVADLQQLQVDAGASEGVSFSTGLELTAGR